MHFQPVIILVSWLMYDDDLDNNTAVCVAAIVQGKNPAVT